MACIGQKRGAYWGLVGKLVGRRLPETIGHRKEAIKIDHSGVLVSP